MLSEMNFILKNLPTPLVSADISKPATTVRSKYMKGL